MRKEEGKEEGGKMKVRGQDGMGALVEQCSLILYAEANSMTALKLHFIRKTEPASHDHNSFQLNCNHFGLCRY